MTRTQEKKPIIEIDDLAPRTHQGGYHASWREGTLTAHAWLTPVSDQPGRDGYTLEFTYNHKQLNRRLSEQQIDTCTMLVAKLRNHLEAQLQLAGWKEIARPKPGQSLWQHSSRLSSREQDQAEQTREAAPVLRSRQTEQKKSGAGLQQEQESVTPDQGKNSKVIFVPGKTAIAAYSRTITASEVTFTCSRCGQQVTKSLFPGPAPLYCDSCAAIVKKEKTRERVARLRARAAQKEVRS